MTAAKRMLADENAPTVPKRVKVTRNSVPPPVVSDHGQHKSSKHAFLDDITGFGGGVSIRHFLNPQAAKLYTVGRVSTFHVSHNLW